MKHYYDKFEWLKKGYGTKDIYMTVALPAFNSEDIMFLPLESLKNQKDICFYWELICYGEWFIAQFI